MATLPKKLVIFCFNLCASLYIGIGGYGTAMGLGSKLLQTLTIWHSVAYFTASILLIRGICYFGQMWDRISAQEAAAV
ncbi:MAG: hypothetical protein HZB63_02670 [Deltaproteobacteria bacterium]|nr:hypothetical protein [Deltaproteobacteria bacterium]